jgi:hypothetical protein
MSARVTCRCCVRPIPQALGGRAVAALLRMSHTESLRPCLQEAGACRARQAYCTIVLPFGLGPHAPRTPHAQARARTKPPTSRQRPLGFTGRSCWKLINAFPAVEDPGNERARPGARLQARCTRIMHMRCPFAQRTCVEWRLTPRRLRALCACGQALLLMGVLFCVGKDGNRAAGKMLNRRDARRNASERPPVTKTLARGARLRF